MPLDDPIFIFDYDSRWPALAAIHTDRIAAALTKQMTLLEHIGSTSVPGLAAKPILDLIVGLNPPGVTARTITKLSKLGFTFYGNEGVPGRGFFRREPMVAGEPPVHLHAFPKGHPALTRDLAFRDTLRADPQLAFRYETLKRALALKNRHDLDGYNQGKERFISRVVGARSEPARWDPTPGGPGEGKAA